MRLTIGLFTLLFGLLALNAEGRATTNPTDAQACEDFAPMVLPAEAVPSKPPKQGPYRKLSWKEAGLNLGIGTIQAKQVRPNETDWINQAWLPLSAKPGAKPWGWIAKGWLVELSKGKAKAKPLGTAGMLETGHEVPSFIVLEENDQGWLRIRWGLGKARNGGTAWVHTCHLAYEDYPLEFQRWEARFLNEQEIGALFFRSSLRHSLRIGPGTEHQRIAWIEGKSYELIPLEVRGEWMRVRYVTPAIACAEPGTEPTAVMDGWTKWRSPKKGSWVYYHTRGC